jgi:hypothetical protein
MSDETATVKKPMRIGSIAIDASNPNEVIVTFLRYHKRIRLHSKLLETKSDNEATPQEGVNG